MRAQDIDDYMAAIPADFVIRDAAGEAITREQLRANVLRDWSIIPKTHNSQFLNECCDSRSFHDGLQKPPDFSACLIILAITPHPLCSSIRTR
jgi:hypothetical protein